MVLTLATAAPDHSVWWWILGIVSLIGLIWWWSAAAGSRARVGMPTSAPRKADADGDADADSGSDAKGGKG